MRQFCSHCKSFSTVISAPSMSDPLKAYCVTCDARTSPEVVLRLVIHERNEVRFIAANVDNYDELIDEGWKLAYL